MAGRRAAQRGEVEPVEEEDGEHGDRRPFDRPRDASGRAREGQLVVVSRWRRHRPSGAHDVVRLVVRARARGRRRRMRTGAGGHVVGVPGHDRAVRVGVGVGEVRERLVVVMTRGRVLDRRPLRARPGAASRTLATIATAMSTRACRAPVAAAAIPSSGGAAIEATDANDDTTATRPAARIGSSDAAAMPTGTASAAPKPHSTMPTPASAKRRARTRTAAAPRSRRSPRRAARHAAEPVDQARAEQPDEGHRADEHAEHRAADGLGLVEPVDDRERQPVVGGPLGQRGRHDDDADQQRAGLAPGVERGGDAAAPARRSTAPATAAARACAGGRPARRAGRARAATPAARRRRATATAVNCTATEMPRCEAVAPSAGAGDGADRERRVELRDDGAAHRALDAGGLHVERHVAERDRDAVEEDADAEQRRPSRRSGRRP